MDRPNLLLGATIAAITISGWADAFGRDTVKSGTKRRLERAIDAARAKGRPLIVLPASPTVGPREDPVAVVWSHYMRFADDL